MNTPNNPLEPRLWTQRQAWAAGRLGGNFADRVMRAARQLPAEHSRTWRFFHNPFALSAITASACLLVAIVYHDQLKRLETEQNLADWRAMTAQLASLDPL